MKKGLKVTLLFMAIVLLFSGCTPSIKNVPSKNTKPTPKGSVTAVDNSTRVLIVSDEGESCLELSADAIVSTTNSSQSGVGVNVNIPNALTAGTDIYNSTTAAGLTAQVFAPTQGMQFYRTGIFALCEAMKNGFVKSDKDYLNQIVALSTMSEKMINAELDVRRSSIQAIAQNSPSEAIASTLTNLASLTQSHYLKVVNNPNTGGNVTSDNLRLIDCGTQCIALNPGSQSITLTARANPGFAFSEWIGCNAGASESNTCTVMVSGQQEITALYKANEQTITFSVEGEGQVRTATSGYICTKECQPLPITYSTLSIGFIAEAADGSRFAGWEVNNAESTCNNSTESTCSIVLQPDKNPHIVVRFVEDQTSAE